MKYYEKEMPTIHPKGCVAMTWEDAEEMESLNADCGWGFGLSNCLRFLSDHMDAFDKGDYLTAEKIEWRLDDANFHTFSKHLNEHSYDYALNWIYNTYVTEAKTF